MSHDLAGYFPYPEIRSEQETAIQFAISTLLDEGKKFVVIEAGTGVGKSAIGLTIARYLAKNMPTSEKYIAGSHFLTTQKVLQEQYLRDFGPPSSTMREIKGAANYTCKFNKGITCDVGLTMLKTEDKTSAFYRCCGGGCVYKQAKVEFSMAPEGVTNFSYFLTEAAYSGRVITPRQVLVVDECHNAEEALGRFVEVTVSERFARTVLKLEMPDFKTEVQAFNWVRDVYSPKLVGHVKHIESVMAKYASIKDKLSEMLKYTQQLDMLQKHKSKIEKFVTLWDPDNWAVNFVPADHKAERKVEFKPVDVAVFSNDSLFKFGQKVVLMSATVINHEAFCTSLGIPLADVGFISIPTPFPAENRPVFCVPAGRMTMDQLDKTIPNMCRVIRGILDQHKGEKGIIHTHSYKIAKAIVDNLKDKRLLIHDSFNRDEIIKRHMSSSTATVIVSPSSTEGLDLYDDNSRFQVLCKIPYPYLGDKLVKKRMARNRKWYPYQTAKTIVQSLGRSIRNMDDHAVSYILDSDWEMFLSRNPEMFNKSFTDSLI